MTTISIVPERKIKDPRQLLYHFPSIPAQKYAKMVATFHHDQMLKMAEKLARGLGYILVPGCCLHWKKKQEFADRQINIGKFTYYTLKREEMTKQAYAKLMQYIQEIHEEEEVS